VTAFLKEVEQQQDSSRCDADLPTKRRILLRIQQSLIAAQEVGDEKLQIVQTIQDLIENKARQLDLDYRNLGEGFHFLFQKKTWQSCWNAWFVWVMWLKFMCYILVFRYSIIGRECSRIGCWWGNLSLWHIWGREECIQDFGGETWRKETTWKTLVSMGG